MIAGRYRLERPIGEGNMGVVWLATDLEARRAVAMKHGSRVRREYPRPKVPHVVEAFDLVKDEADEEWLVMEYLPSRSLATLLQEDGPLAPARAAAIGAQIASALAVLHGEHHMVHRDITPGNILVTEDGLAKLIDFGIATWGNVTQTEDVKIAGTPYFRSPEVDRGNRATEASDVYSLGATLAGAVEGHPSPDAEEGSPFRTVLDALLERDPERRPTANQARQRLLEVAGAKRRQRWWMPAAAVAVLVVAALSLWLSYLLPTTNAGTETTGTATPTTSEDSSTVTLPASLVGDTNTADPCALIHTSTLAKFGQVSRRDDYGNFNRCDALVFPSRNHEDFVDLDVEFDVGGPAAGVPVKRVGGIGLQRESAEDDCGRILLLPQGFRVVISARETGRVRADRCGMADAVTDGALAALHAGPISRRVLPPESLAGRDACQLLDTATVTGVLGPGTVRQEGGFAGWDCDWRYAGPGQPKGKVIFDRTSADSLGDGTAVTLSGHTAYVEPKGYGDTDCLVSIVYREYVDGRGALTDELVLVDVDDSALKPQQLCAPAQRLATTVAQRLAT